MRITPNSARSPPDTLAAISYTGGTTGLPKGVMQSHGNLLANAKHMLIANPLLPTDRFIHAAPMFHAADAATTFALTFMGGAHVCIRGYEPELFGRIVEAEKVTVALIVPTMINMLLNHPATPSRDFSVVAFAHVRRVTDAGGTAASGLQSCCRATSSSSMG